VNYQITVGQMIIDSEQVHVVSKIENNNIYYKPLLKDNNKGSSSSFIPLDNFSKACLRPLLKKDEVKELLKQLAKELPLDFPKSTNQTNTSNLLKEVLYQNDPLKTGRLLIYLNLRTSEAELSRFERLIFDQAIDHLSAEISVVNNISLDIAKKQILLAVKR
jgi:RNA polymerase-interacting CarD/CdnL/TRCF family regulator